MAEAIMMNKKSDWRLITHKVFTEDAIRWKTNVDDNGNPFSLSAFKAYIRSCANTSEYSGWVSFAPYYTNWANDCSVLFSFDATKTAGDEFGVECEAEIVCGYIFPSAKLDSVNRSTNKGLTCRTGEDGIVQKYNNGQPVALDSITGFSINGYAVGALPAGTEIWIWGKE